MISEDWATTELGLSAEYALLVLAGIPPAPSLARKLAERATHIICTDGAAGHARNAGLRVDSVVGDMDSLSRELSQELELAGTRILQVEDQESNDFEKALTYLCDAGIRDLRVVGIEGKRIDHTLSNFAVMSRYASRFEKLVAYDIQNECSVLYAGSPDYSVIAEVGSTLSIIPFPEGEGISTLGLQYPLHSASLRFGIREGLSNVVVQPMVTVTIESGSVLIVRQMIAESRGG